MSTDAGSIELRGVSKRYGNVEALRPFDLRIENGEFFCLLGPSGCGKTTTLNLIGGFVPATSGEIWLGGPGSTAFRRTGGRSTRCSSRTPSFRT